MSTTEITPDNPPDHRAACCAAFYEQDWVATLMADSFHPGGPAMSERLLDGLDLPEGCTVVDIACGTGTTALALARRGHRVIAIDFSEKNLARLTARAEESGLDDRIQTVQADAASLPLGDASATVVLAECALSTFPDKPKSVAEIARVLEPGGLVGITDMVLNAPLPAALADVIGPWACLQDAMTVPGYQRLFLDAGLRATAYIDESEGLHMMARELKRKLVVVGLGKMAGALGEMNLDIASARALIEQSTSLVDSGVIEYARMTFALGVPKRTDAKAAAEPCCEQPSSCC